MRRRKTSEDENKRTITNCHSPPFIPSFARNPGPIPVRENQGETVAVPLCLTNTRDTRDDTPEIRKRL